MRRYAREARAQAGALRAAVSNLSDHAEALDAVYGQLAHSLQEQSSRHQDILDNFEVTQKARFVSKQHE